MEKLHEKEFVSRFMIVMLMLIFVLCSFFSWNEMRIKKIDVSSVTLLSSEATLNIEENYYVDASKLEKAKLVINGWIAVQGKETKPVAIHVLLKNISTNEYYELPTTIQVRTDATSYFKDGINYDNSGFSVELSCSKKKKENEIYEIYILYEIGNDIYLIPSGKNIKSEVEVAD